MSRLQQHCQMIQNYLNVVMEMIWKKKKVFFFLRNEENNENPVTETVSGLALSLTLKQQIGMLTNQQHNSMTHTKHVHTKHISHNTLCWCYRDVTCVPSCCTDGQKVCENLHSANWATFHPEAWRYGLGACLCSPPWPTLLPWSREIWPWEVQWWEQRKHQKLHIPAIWIWPKELHW